MEKLKYLFSSSLTMELLPFFAGKEIPEEYLSTYFFDRQRELKELLLKLQQQPPLNIALYGQRRMGKTSLLEKLKVELRHKKCFPILLKCEQLIPLEPLAFLQNLAVELLREYNTFSPLSKAATAVREQLGKTKIGLEVADLTFWMEFGKKNVSLKEAFDKCFSLLKAIIAAAGTKVIVLFDEFQELFSFGDEFLWALRSYISSSKASFVVSSSWHKFKEELTHQERPFFNFFDAYEVGAVNKEEARKYLESRIKTVKISFAPGVVENILWFSECRPYYLQHLALTAYTLAKVYDKRIITDELYAQAVTEVIKTIPAHLVSQFRKLRGHNRDVFVALCLVDLATPTELAAKVRMEPKNVVVILQRLLELGLVEKNGAYAVADKFLKEYVKQEFSH